MASLRAVGRSAAKPRTGGRFGSAYFRSKELHPVGMVIVLVMMAGNDNSAGRGSINQP